MHQIDYSFHLMTHLRKADRLAAVHQWATPRILAAAALVRGGPVESVMQELSA